MGSGFEPDYKAIGNRIKQARKRQKITQKKLAEMTDLSTSHMSHIESGKTKVSLPSLIPVSYTHLDVYKRQLQKEAHYPHLCRKSTAEAPDVPNC